MELTNDDDSGLEGNVDELLMSAIEENEKLRNKIISLKVEKEESKRRKDLLENKLKEKEEICGHREAEIVSLSSKEDESDEDELVVIKKKPTNHFPYRKGGNDELDEENDYAGSQEVLFMEFTNDDDSRLKGNVDELLMSSIE